MVVALPLPLMVGDKLLSFSFLQSSTAVCFCIAPQSIFPCLSWPTF